MLHNPSSVPASSTKSVAFPVLLILPVSSQEVLLIIYLCMYINIYVSIKFRQFGLVSCMRYLGGQRWIFTHSCAHISSQLRAGQEDNLPLTRTGMTMLICTEPLNRFAN